MGKIDYTKVPTSDRRKMVQELAKFLVSIREEKEMVQVLYRLLTHSEVVMLGRRLRIAEELLQGRSYLKIQEKLRVGVATIRLVDRWLEYAVRDYEMLRASEARARIERDMITRSRRYRGPDMPLSFHGVVRLHGGIVLILLALLDSVTERKKAET